MSAPAPPTNPLRPPLAENQKEESMQVHYDRIQAMRKEALVKRQAEAQAAQKAGLPTTHAEATAANAPKKGKGQQ